MYSSTFYDNLKTQLDEYDSVFNQDFNGMPAEFWEVKSGTFGCEDGFGADYSHDTATVKAIQGKLNDLGFGPLATDGAFGPKSKAALISFQRSKGLVPDGTPGDATLAALGLKGSNIVESVLSEIPKSSRTDIKPGGPVKIATVIAALRQAGKEKGYDLSDGLLRLMIGQLRGAEGAYPGVTSSLGGTNNMGAAQVVKSLMTQKKGMKGWGAFAHRDSDPNKGAYIGWYWIAPSPLEAARHWFGDNWWGSALARGNPQDATSYAAILYKGRYFGGMHAGDPDHDPNSAAGKLNVADYAAAINRGVASASELADKPDDPSKLTVDPTQFATLDARNITSDLFDKAKSGGIGSSWSYLLPPAWNDLVKTNGVVWFGPPPGKKKSMWGWIVGGIAAAAGVTAIVAGGRKAAA